MDNLHSQGFLRTQTGLSGPRPSCSVSGMVPGTTLQPVKVADVEGSPLGKKQGQWLPLSGSGLGDQGCRQG